MEIHTDIIKVHTLGFHHLVVTNYMFIHLHGHSHYSLLEAIGSPQTIVNVATKFQMNAIALTDYNGMYGAIEFYQACQKAGIKPLLGVELGYVYNRHEMPKDEQAGHIVLLAKNVTGYQALLQLTSEANLNGFHEGKARIDYPLLERHAGDIIAIIGGQYSYLGKMILANEPSSKIQELITQLTELLGGDNVFLEYVAQDESLLPDLKKVNHAIINISESTNTPVIVTSNFHYCHQDELEIFEVALAIKDGKRMYDKDKRNIQGNRYIMDTTTIQSLMTKNGLSLEQASTYMQTTQQIADMINIEIDMDTILFPKYDTPDNIRKLYEQYQSQLIE